MSGQQTLGLTRAKNPGAENRSIREIFAFLERGGGEEAFVPIEGMLKGKRKGDQRFLSRIISQEYWDISSATSLNYRFLTNFFLALDRGLTFKEIPFTGNILFLSSSFFFKQRWWEAEIRGKRYSININRDLKLNGRTWKLKSWICLFKKLARSFERWVGIYGGWSRNLQIYFGPSSVRASLSRLIRKFRGPLRARIAVFAFNGVFFPGRRIPTEIGSSKPARLITEPIKMQRL